MVTMVAEASFIRWLTNSGATGITQVMAILNVKCFYEEVLRQWCTHNTKLVKILPETIMFPSDPEQQT
jgi:hypothetical protein